MALMDAATRRLHHGGADINWISGDHHVHSTFSPDGAHTIYDQVRWAHDNGLDWVAITDHGSTCRKQ